MMFDVPKQQPTDKKTLVRSFSDEWETKEPDNALAKSLAVKVEQDREADTDKARRRKE